MKKLILLLALAAQTAWAQGTTKVTWYGHAAFGIVTPKGAVLMIDPWLNNPMNPNAQADKRPLASVGRVDYILITHGHFDHVGDAVGLGKATKARLVANFELGTNMARVLGYPATQMGFDTLMNSGGAIQIADGEVTVIMTPAVHSSSLDPSSETNKNAPLVFGGNPNGFVIKIANGPTIYHTGDTAYFEDMKQLAAHHPDLALVNIGGHFGMEPDDAAKAAKAVGAKLVVPHHFKTFPILTQDPAPFFKALDRQRIAHKLMEVGATIEFVGNKLKQ